MKTLSISEIIDKVRVKLDEIAANESEMVVTEEDNSNLNKVIESCVADAYRFVSLNANPGMLEGKHEEGSTLNIDGSLVGRVAIPSDFLRLINIRLSSWISACSTVVLEDSPEYRMQSNKWVCGNPQKPVVALTHTPSGRVLELYKASTDKDTLKAFTYVPIWNGSGNVELAEQVVDAFIYYVAGLTMVTFREDVSDRFFAIARNLLGLE